VTDVVVCDLAVGAFRVVDRLILVHRVRVTGNDIPGVDQARDITEAAESDVDERVSGAEADFDPYYSWN
jgi:hypothetical protein